MFNLRHDLRLAVRSLMGAKGPVAIAVLTLALGIGVTSAVFSILDAVVIRPVPYPDGDRLVEVWNYELTSKVSHTGMPPALVAEWRRQSDLFDRVEGYSGVSSIYDGPAGAEMLNGTIVTPQLLAMLGARPVVGRLFSDGDGRSGRDDLIVINETFWRQSLGRDANVVGQKLMLDQRPHEIVGVMPATFRFPDERTAFWKPYDLDAPPPGKNAPRLRPFARLRADMPFATAVERVSDRGDDLNKATGGPTDRSARLEAAGNQVDRKTRLSLLVLGGAVAFLLLIVCANLANLSLARALVRARDFAVRSSLGASRADLMRETLVEHAVIGALGAIGGLAVAAGVLQLTLEMLPQSFRLATMNALDLDLRTLGFTTLVGLVTVLLFGLPPAWLASRSAVADVLKRESRSSSGSVGARRLRNALVVAEVSLAIVLLVGAALMARSLIKLQAVDRGFDAKGLIAMRLGMPRAGYADPYARDGFTTKLIDRLRAMPGVTGATAGGVPPDSSMISFGKIERADRPGELTNELIVPVYQVWPNYFSTIGIPVNQGRAFEDDEASDAVIVSQSLAKAYWPNGNAVGQRLRFEGGNWRQIIGVAGEVRQMGMDDESGSFEMYYPAKRPPGLPPPAAAPPDAGAIASYRTFVVRASNVSDTVVALRSALHEVDPRVVIWRVDPVERLFADAIARPRLVLLLMTVFAGLGLVLAAAGIYGVLSYAVVQRRREIGIRLALGARPQSVGQLIVSNGLMLTGIGILLGLGLALALTRVMRTLLYDVEPTDAASVSAVALLIVIVAAAASWWPARRAMHVDPLSLLRDE